MGRPPLLRVSNEVKVMDCKNDRARRIQRTFVVGRQKYGDAVSRELERQAHLIPPLSPVTLDRLKSEDRKSTRLNSSHGYISYAVFCLKKKKNNTKNTFEESETEELDS